MANQQKYIRVDSLCGMNDVFVLFSPMINHNQMVRSLKLSESDVISAGFVQNIVKDGERQANCHGKSVTLKRVSLPEDTQMLARQHYSVGKDQKYLRADPLADQDHAIILIPNAMAHSEFAERLRGATSGIVTAGFVSNDLDGKRMSPTCYGVSESLGLESVEEDTDLLIEQHYRFLMPDPWEQAS